MTIFPSSCGSHNILFLLYTVLGLKFFLFRCYETSQFNEYEQLNRKLYHANDKMIHSMTGCLSKCDRFDYHIYPMTDLTEGKDAPNLLLDPSKPWNEGNETSQMALWFYHPTGETEIREQV